MEEAPYWFPVVTLVAGAVLGYLADFLRETKADSRQRKQARRDFDRQTLIDFQDALANLARATGRVPS
jgi:hypothetical protein